MYDAPPPPPTPLPPVTNPLIEEMETDVTKSALKFAVCLAIKSLMRLK
jgi:hypothetical protein